MGNLSVCDSSVQERIVDYQQFGSFSPRASRISTLSDASQKISLKRYGVHSQEEQTSQMLNEISNQLAELTKKINTIKGGEGHNSRFDKNALRSHLQNELKDGISRMKTTVPHKQTQSRFVGPVTHNSSHDQSRIDISRLF